MRQLTASTSRPAIIPRTKISCAVGMCWLACLISASLMMNSAMPAHIQAMPRRLARARSARAPAGAAVLRRSLR